MVYHHVRQQACHLMPFWWIAHFQLKLASTCIKVFTFGCLNWAKRCGGVALMKPSDSEADKVGLRDQQLMNQQVRIRTLWESFRFSFLLDLLQLCTKDLTHFQAFASGAQGSVEDLQLWSFPKTIPHFAIKINLGTVPLNQKSVMVLRWMRNPAQLTAVSGFLSVLGRTAGLLISIGIANHKSKLSDSDLDKGFAQP